MQFRFFTIPTADSEAPAEELNRFLAAHRIVSVERHFAADGVGSHWAVCVSYLDGPSGGTRRRGKVDYREVLPEADFAVFAKLRALRKTLAEREGVPAYALFTNEQLAEMVTARVTSVSGLHAIPGVGDARVQKYGASFLEILKTDIPTLDPSGSDTGR